MSNNPFPGPQPYRAADRGRFYGRDALIKKLANQILARSATTVFGPSGAGKSSLLQAGVIPALEDSDDIRLVRVDAWPAGEMPLPWLVNTIAADLELGPRGNTQMSVDALQETIDLAGRQSDRPMLVYLDQFEQVFIADHHEKALKDLLDGLTWLIRRKQNRELHLVLSLREDYLGRLRDWTREKPELSAHGFRVGPLTVGEMVKAVCRTAADGDPPQTWNPDEIRSLMLDVRVSGQSRAESAEIQAAFAQIVCRAVWDELAAGKNLDMRTANAESILHRYLDTTLAGLGNLQESALKLLEQHLIDDEGHRTLLTEKEARTVLPAKEAVDVLGALEKAAVLHAEEHQGSRYFELGHDWLAKKVFERRIERKEREAAEAKAALEREARRRFRRNLAYTTIAWVILGSLTAWALWERSVAKDAQRTAQHNEREATRNSKLAKEAENKAVRSSRMANARDLMLTGQPDIAAMVLTEVEDPALARGWMQAAIDALKVRLPYSTLRFGAQSQPTQWSHDGTRVLVYSPDGAVTIAYGDRKTKPVPLAIRTRLDAMAFWSPNDEYVLVEGGTSAAALVLRADGTGKPVELGESRYRLTHAAWSPDGKRLLIGFGDNTDRMFTAGQWDDTVARQHEGKDLQFVAWSPDGTKIASTVGVTYVMDVIVQAAGDASKILSGITAVELSKVAWSADGKHVAGVTRKSSEAEGEGNRTITITNSESPTVELEVDVGKGVVRDLQWAPYGRRLLVAVGNFGRIIDMDRTTEREKGTLDLRGHTNDVLHVAWSPNGQRIATASADKSVRVWNASYEGPGWVLAGHSDSDIRHLAWSPDGKRILTTALDGTARTWNVEGAWHPVVFDAHYEILEAAWSPDGTRVLTNSADGDVQVWNIDGSGPGSRLRDPEESIRNAHWASEGTTVVSIVTRQKAHPRNDVAGNNRRAAAGAARRPGPLKDRVVKVRNADGSGEPKTLNESDSDVSQIAVSPNGLQVAAIADRKSVIVFDLQRKRAPVTLDVEDLADTKPLWSRDSKRLALLTSRGEVILRNADGSDKPIVLTRSPAKILMGAFSPDGQQFAMVGEDGRGRVWKVATPDEPIEFVAHQGTIWHLAWSPDGTSIATVSADGTLRISKATGDNKPILLQGHESGSIWMVQWSPDGSRLVTASEDKTARVWNADGTGTPLVLAGHERSVRQALWSPDGKRILTVSEDKTARIWLVDIPLLQDALRKATINCLGPEQRETYLIESAEVARQKVEQCEREQGRTP